MAEKKHSARSRAIATALALGLSSASLPAYATDSDPTRQADSDRSVWPIGTYLTTPHFGSVISTDTAKLAYGIVYFSPVYLTYGATIKALAFNVSSAPNSGNTVRMALTAIRETGCLVSSKLMLARD